MLSDKKDKRFPYNLYKIETKVEALQNWELRYMEHEQAYKHDEKKAVIEAAKAIGEAYAKNQPVPIYKVNVW